MDTRNEPLLTDETAFGQQHNVVFAEGIFLLSMAITFFRKDYAISLYGCW